MTPITVTSRKNETLVRLKRLGQSAAFRRQEGEFVCDGAKLLAEALAHGAEVRTLVCTDLPELPIPENTRVLLTPRDVLESISPMDTPQGVLFSCAVPEEDESPLPGELLILENVQDPGNVGTVLRTANAFGCGAVVLVGACADPYSPKTIRASMGAVFRQRFCRRSLEEIAELVRNGLILYGAALYGSVVSLDRADLAGVSVAVGSEGRGLSPEMLELCRGSIRIPMAPECESLNAAAAAAVLLWEMRRAREKKS